MLGDHRIYFWLGVVPQVLGVRSWGFGAIAGCIGPRGCGPGLL